MKKLVVVLALVSSSLALAGPKKDPSRGEGLDPEERVERREERAKQARMVLLVAIAEALELNEAQALKLSDTLRGLDEKRRPVREAMFEAMRQVRAAAEGDPSALATVDQSVQRVLEGRAQMAQLDKELFATLAQGQPPQRKARLALVLAKVGDELRRMKAGKGRRHR
jgi:hypothetical protein